MSRRMWRRRRLRGGEALVAAAVGVGLGLGAFYLTRLLLGREALGAGADEET